MEEEQLLACARKIYLSQEPIYKILAEHKQDAAMIEKLRSALEDYLDTKDHFEALAEKHDVDKSVMRAFLKDFEMHAIKSWEIYVSRDNPNLAGAAEAVGMKRFCFEDYFWLNNGIDDNSDEAKARLESVKQEFESRYRENTLDTKTSTEP